MNVVPALRFVTLNKLLAPDQIFVQPTAVLFLLMYTPLEVLYLLKTCPVHAELTIKNVPCVELVSRWRECSIFDSTPGDSIKNPTYSCCMKCCGRGCFCQHP